MNSTLVWYTSRASGIVAWALLAGSVLWGLFMSTRLAETVRRRAWLLDLHRFLGAGALVFVVVHVSSILLDTYTHFGLTEVLVPLTGSWRPGAVAWGIVAMYLLVALEVTSLLRRVVPRRVWRRTHYLSFPLFAFATIHGLTAGTDRHSAALRIAFYSVSWAAGVLVVMRAVTARRARADALTELARDRGRLPLDGAGASLPRSG